MIKISTDKRVKAQRYIVWTSPERMYELIYQESFFRRKPKFYCKLVKGNVPGMSKKFTKVMGFMLNRKLLNAELENFKVGVTIWMKKDARTSIVRVIKKF